MQKPSASSSSFPGVRIVTATGVPPMRISSGSSTATRSCSRPPPGRRRTSTAAAEYGGASMTPMLRLFAGLVLDLARRAHRNDVLEDGPVAVERGRDVTRRDLVGPALDRPRELARSEELAHDLALVPLERNRIVEVVPGLLEHPRDERVELRQRLRRILAQPLFEGLQL